MVAMNTALKARLNALAKQLDEDQQRALKGELEAVLKKYEHISPSKKISKRKIEQFDRVSEKFNKWVDSEVEYKSQYTGLSKLTHNEKYEELHKSGAVPRKESRTVSDITVKSSDPTQSINHAINRMKTLMSKKGQAKKLQMSRDAFATAFNLPGGGVLDTQLRKKLKSMSQAEWEIFVMDNKKLIAKIWEEYHNLMKKLADPNYMLGRSQPESMESLYLETVLTEIDAVKKARRIELAEAAADIALKTITRGIL